MAQTDTDSEGTVTDNNPSGVPVLSLSDAALAKVLKLRAEEPEAESLALWVEISGVGGGAYSYDVYFQTAKDAQPDDWTGAQNGLMIVVPSDSARRT